MNKESQDIWIIFPSKWREGRALNYVRERFGEYAFIIDISLTPEQRKERSNKKYVYLLI